MMKMNANKGGVFMNTRKIIVVDPDMDAKLGAVCNSALKLSGLDLLSDVTTLINSVKEEAFEDKEMPLNKKLVFED